MAPAPSFGPTLLLALGLAVFLEGVFYFLMSSRVRWIGELLASMEPGRVRLLGLVTAASGVGWMLLVRWIYW